MTKIKKLIFQIHTDWPSYLRNKGIFFVKRDNDGIPENEDEDNTNYDLLDYLACGDIHPNVLGQVKHNNILSWGSNDVLCCYVAFFQSKEQDKDHY